jgi:tryptophan 2-monooxygenase
MRTDPAVTSADISAFGPDFPFSYVDWLGHQNGLGTIPPSDHGTEVAIIGGGIAGVVAAFELMRLGFKPVVFEVDRLGGRLRSHRFDGVDGAFAELGGMRFPASSRTFYHYVNQLGLTTKPFPNPLSPGSPSTVIDIDGESHYAQTVDDLPPMFREVSAAWRAAMEQDGQLGAMRAAIAARDPARVKAIWDPMVRAWDDRTFYDFLAQSRAFSSLSFALRELFGQVGFGTGGWDSDFSTSMLEIFRVVMTACAESQSFIAEGAEQVVRRLWSYAPEHLDHWPPGTSLQSLHRGSHESGVARVRRATDGEGFDVTNVHGQTRRFGCVLATCQSWLLTTGIEVEETLFSQKLWMALDRTRYMQSSKTFVLVDRPFWKDIDPQSGRHPMSTTLTDRHTRGTYLFDYGDDRPGVICLSYAWMSDAMKMLPLSTDRRVELALEALGNIYPEVELAKHIIGEPVSVSWEADPNFLGAFKCAMPGHYRYNRRMFTHFMQDERPAAQRGIFLAGDDISWTPGWAEGAVQTALNAVWGIMHHYGGASPADNPGPGDCFADIAPLALPD